MALGSGIHHDALVDLLGHNGMTPWYSVVCSAMAWHGMQWHGCAMVCYGLAVGVVVVILKVVGLGGCWPSGG